MQIGGASFAGPPFLGVVFSGFFASLLYAAAVAYYVLFPDDSRPRRLLVAGLTAISLLSFGDNIFFAWRFIVAPPPGINTIFSAAGLPLTIAVTVLSGVLSQCFYSHRLYVVSGRKRLLVAVCVFLSASYCVLGSVSFVLSVMSGGGITKTMEWWLVTGLGIAAIDDLVLTVTLFWVLRKHQKGFNRDTDKVISRILELSITTGSISSVVALLSAVVTASGVHRFHNTTGLAFMFLIPQMSGIMVIGTLLSRRIVTSSGGAQAYVYGPELPTDPPMDMTVSLPVAPSSRFIDGRGRTVEKPFVHQDSELKSWGTRSSSQTVARPSAAVRL